MSVIAIIPARYASTRFPGKMLADRTGRPLIQHVYEQVVQSEAVDRTLIATDDDRILEAARAFGAEAVMTRADHPNGSSRLAEVAASLPRAELIVNVQGDEPELPPALIDRAVEHLRQSPDAVVGTLASPFAADEDPADPNIVKVVRDQRGCALYFSRARLPYPRDGETLPHAKPLKHIGLYVYRRPFLLRYVMLPETPLERAEKLEQLRILENGEKIAVAVVGTDHHGIDTPEQYEAFVRREEARARSRSGK